MEGVGEGGGGRGERRGGRGGGGKMVGGRLGRGGVGEGRSWAGTEKQKHAMPHQPTIGRSHTSCPSSHPSFYF